jgi:hypothetical protein
VGPRAGLDAVVKRKFPGPCRDSNYRSLIIIIIIIIIIPKINNVAFQHVSNLVSSREVSVFFYSNASSFKAQCAHLHVK